MQRDKHKQSKRIPAVPTHFLPDIFGHVTCIYKHKARQERRSPMTGSHTPWIAKALKVKKTCISANSRKPRSQPRAAS